MNERGRDEPFQSTLNSCKIDCKLIYLVRVCVVHRNRDLDPSLDFISCMLPFFLFLFLFNLHHRIAVWREVFRNLSMVWMVDRGEVFANDRFNVH